MQIKSPIDWSRYRKTIFVRRPFSSWSKLRKIEQRWAKGICMFCNVNGILAHLQGILHIWIFHSIMKKRLWKKRCFDLRVGLSCLVRFSFLDTRLLTLQFNFFFQNYFFNSWIFKYICVPGPYLKRIDSYLVCKMFKNISPDLVRSDRICPANLGVRSCPVGKLICPVRLSPT